MQATSFIVDHSHANAWQKGKRNLPKEIYRFLLDNTFEYNLKLCDLHNKKLRAKLELFRINISYPGVI